MQFGDTGSKVSYHTVNLLFDFFSPNLVLYPKDQLGLIRYARTWKFIST